MPSSTRHQRDSNGLPNIPARSVNNFISVDKYYRSADLLIRQAGEYRARQNDIQLYTILMRLASLVIETIPRHKEFNKNALEAKKLKQALVTQYFPELESLKLQLQLKMGEDSSAWMQQPHSHTPNTVQLSTSNLPQLDWDNQHAFPSAHPSHTYAIQPSPATSSSHFLDDFPSSYPHPSLTGRLPSNSLDASLPTFQTNLPSASQATRDRHALLPSLAPKPTSQKRDTVTEPLYPNFDTSPFSAIDYSNNLHRQNHAQPQQSQIDQQVNELRMDDHPQASMEPSLIDSLATPRPSHGPMLGPQETEVNQMPYVAREPDPDATCCLPQPAPPPLPPPPDEQPGNMSEQKEIREVHVSMGLMEEFLAYAKSNTRRGIESCGILAGILDSKRGLFSITTLIVPKQEGTSDTVQALAEEEIFEAQDNRGLYPMGWIHTHPTQTCFLSSIDVHTQCGYQTMLDEAIAIVMAPSDRSKRCGIFRLSTPGGLKLVQKCQSRGFHMHPSTETGQPVYEVCGHVYLNERLGHDVIDLR